MEPPDPPKKTHVGASSQDDRSSGTLLPTVASPAHPAPISALLASKNPAAPTLSKKNAKGEWETPKSRRKGRSTKSQGPDQLTSPKPALPVQFDRKKANPAEVEEDAPRFPVGEFDSRYGRAGEWPFEEDYTYRIERVPFPIMKKPDPILFRPKPPPKVVVVHEPPNVGWTPGFRNFPREILRFIFTLVCEDFAAVRQVRRVCSAWRKLVSTLPIHVRYMTRWMLHKKHLSTKITGTLPALARLRCISPHIVSLDLGRLVVLPYTSLVELEAASPTLTHLSFAAHSSWNEFDVRALLALTSLESLSVHYPNLGPLCSSRRRLRSAFTRLHTLELAETLGGYSFRIDDETIFPAITSFTLLSNYYMQSLAITNTTVRNQLRYVTFAHCKVDRDLCDVLMGARLESVQLFQCTAYGFYTPVYTGTPESNFSVQLLVIGRCRIAPGNLPSFPQMTYLDWSGRSHYLKWLYRQVKFPSVEVLRSVGVPIELWIDSVIIGNFPRLRQVIARKEQFVPEYCRVFEAMGIEMIYSGKQ